MECDGAVLERVVERVMERVQPMWSVCSVNVSYGGE